MIKISSAANEDHAGRDRRFASLPPQKSIEMKTITQTTYPPSYETSIQFGLFRRFMEWCKSQDKNRFGWLALSLAAHGCIITPLVVFFVGITGNDFSLWIAAMVAMGITLIVNLAAQPTKITIPIFFLSIVVDIAIITVCIVQSVAN